MWFIFLLCARTVSSQPFIGSAIMLSTSDDAGRGRQVVTQEAYTGLGWAPPLEVLEGVDARTLSLTREQEGSETSGPHKVVASDGLNNKVRIRAWDWRSGMGIGANDEAAFTRILACTVGHLRAIALALARDRWPALIIEDDVDFQVLQGAQGADELARALACVNASDASWRLLRVGYLIASAAQGAQQAEASSPIVRRREACSADWRTFGTQAYILSEAGARAILDSYWPQGTALVDRGAQRLDVDLSRHVVNPAADYLIFNAADPHVWTTRRPLIVESSLGATSNIFQGLSKASSRRTTLVNDALLRTAHGGKACPASLTTSAAAGKIRGGGGGGGGGAPKQRRTLGADYILWGEWLVELPWSTTLAELAVDLGAIAGSVARATLGQCFDACGGSADYLQGQTSKEEEATAAAFKAGGDFAKTTHNYFSVVFPSSMQCWRAEGSLDVEDGDARDCLRAGAHGSAAECDALLRALATARNVTLSGGGGTQRFFGRLRASALLVGPPALNGAAHDAMRRAEEALVESEERFDAAAVLAADAVVVEALGDASLALSLRWAAAKCRSDNNISSGSSIIKIAAANDDANEDDDGGLLTATGTARFIRGLAAAAAQVEVARLDFGISDGASIPPSLCGPYRAFSSLTSGQLSPMLAVATSDAAYRALKSALRESAEDHPVRAWRELAEYAIASLEHSFAADRWDERAFPDRAARAASRRRQGGDSSFWAAKRIEGDAAAAQALSRGLRRVSSSSSSSSLLITGKGGYATRSFVDYSVAPLVLAVGTAECFGLRALRRSTVRAGVDLEVLGLDLGLSRGEYAHDLKLRLVEERLETLVDRSRLVVFVDAYDVILTRRIIDELPRLFRDRFVAPVVFSTERVCHPDAALCHHAPLLTPFINTGSYAGAAADVAKMLLEVRTDLGAFAECASDDTYPLQRFALNGDNNMIELDVDSLLFQTTHGTSWSVDLDANNGDPILWHVLQDGKRATVPSKPSVIHFNSHDGKAMLETLAAALGLDDDAPPPDSSRPGESSKTAATATATRDQDIVVGVASQGNQDADPRGGGLGGGVPIASSSPPSPPPPPPPPSSPVEEAGHHAAAAEDQGREKTKEALLAALVAAPYEAPEARSAWAAFLENDEPGAAAVHWLFAALDAARLGRPDDAATYRARLFQARSKAALKRRDKAEGEEGSFAGAAAAPSRRTRWLLVCDVGHAHDLRSVDFEPCDVAPTLGRACYHSINVVRRLVELIDVDVWVVAEDDPRQLPSALDHVSVDVVWALLDRTVVSPAFARKLYALAGPTRLVFNAGGVSYAKDVLHDHRPPWTPSLEFDPALHEPPAFAKTKLTAQDKFVGVEQGVLADGRLAERYHVLEDAGDIAGYMADDRFAVQKLAVDWRKESTSLNFVERVCFAYGDVTSYTMASPTWVVKQGSTRPRPTFSWMAREERELPFDAAHVLDMDYRPRRIPFSYDGDASRWASVRRSVEYYQKALGLDFAVFELVRIDQDTAVLIDANPTPLEEGFSWQALEVSSRGMLRRVHQDAKRHQSALLVRHAQTAYNSGWEMLGRDVGERDSPLSQIGHAQAAALSKRYCEGGRSGDRVEVVFASPYARALQTALEGFFPSSSSSSKCPRPPTRLVAHPALRERYAMAHTGERRSQDEGSLKEDLERRFPMVDFRLLDNLPQKWWLWDDAQRTERGPDDEESDESVKSRLDAFWKDVSKFDAKSVAVVTHQDLLRGFTNLEFDNTATADWLLVSDSDPSTDKNEDANSSSSSSSSSSWSLSCVTPCASPAASSSEKDGRSSGARDVADRLLAEASELRRRGHTNAAEGLERRANALVEDL